MQDVTGDGLPEVLVWSVSLGASGWTSVLDVYGKDMGQRYVEAP